jgi:predicted metal-dependent hydrolase
MAQRWSKIEQTRKLRALVQNYAEAAQKGPPHNKSTKSSTCKMTTKWASHSQNNNLTINTQLKTPPKRPNQLHNLP